MHLLLYLFDFLPKNTFNLCKYNRPFISYYPLHQLKSYVDVKHCTIVNILLRFLPDRGWINLWKKPNNLSARGQIKGLADSQRAEPINMFVMVELRDWASLYNAADQKVFAPLPLLWSMAHVRDQTHTQETTVCLHSTSIGTPHHPDNPAEGGN